MPQRNGLSEPQLSPGGRKLLGVVLLREIRSPPPPPPPPPLHLPPQPSPVASPGPSLDSQNHKLDVGSLSRLPEMEPGKKNKKPSLVLSLPTSSVSKARKGIRRILMATTNIITSQILLPIYVPYWWVHFPQPMEKHAFQISLCLCLNLLPQIKFPQR